MKFNEQVNLDRVAVVLVMPLFADNATLSLWGMYYIIHKTQAVLAYFLNLVLI